MYARAVDDAAARLRDLRHDEWEKFGLAGFTLVISVAATELLPDLAMPLFIGALVVGAFGVRALWRRWDLVERLSHDRDAYGIAEVLAFARRESTMDRRRSFAALLRGWLDESRVTDPRLAAVAEELLALAAELDDEGLDFDPASAVLCLCLLTDLSESPLLDSGAPSDSLRWRVRQIRAGFRPRRLAA